MNLCGHQISQATKENILRISALASKMGQIKKRKKEWHFNIFRELPINITICIYFFGSTDFRA